MRQLQKAPNKLNSVILSSAQASSVSSRRIAAERYRQLNMKLILAVGILGLFFSCKEKPKEFQHFIRESKLKHVVGNHPCYEVLENQKYDVSTNHSKTFRNLKINFDTIVNGIPILFSINIIAPKKFSAITYPRMLEIIDENLPSFISSATESEMKLNCFYAVFTDSIREHHDRVFYSRFSEIAIGGGSSMHSYELYNLNNKTLNEILNELNLKKQSSRLEEFKINEEFY